MIRCPISGRLGRRRGRARRLTDKAVALLFPPTTAPPRLELPRGTSFEPVGLQGREGGAVGSECASTDAGRKEFGRAAFPAAGWSQRVRRVLGAEMVSDVVGVVSEDGREVEGELGGGSKLAESTLARGRETGGWDTILLLLEGEGMHAGAAEEEAGAS